MSTTFNNLETPDKIKIEIKSNRKLILIKSLTLIKVDLMKISIFHQKCVVKRGDKANLVTKHYPSHFSITVETLMAHNSKFRNATEQNVHVITT